MARLAVTNVRVQTAIARLCALYLSVGSVKALSAAINAQSPDTPEDHIYPNRLHALLAGDESKSINSSTLETIETALSTIEIPQSNDLTRPSPLTRDVLNLVRTQPSVSIAAIAEQFQIPAAVAQFILNNEPDAARRASRSGSPVEELTVSRAKEPDWSFQDTAIKRCLDELAAGPGRKVGLVLPTAGGKTRTALQVALLFARKHPKGDICWLTHRIDLKDQAEGELQELLNVGTPDTVTELDLQNFRERFEFLMLNQLDRRLEESSNPPALVIVDEAHHAAAASYGSLFTTQYPLPALFLTATPNRTDDLPIGIDTIAYSTTYRDLSKRGVVVIPEFEAFPVDNFDWSEESLEDLADFLIERTRGDFRKVIVLTPRIDKAQSFYYALRDRLLKESYHPLDAEDLGYVHSEGNSLGIPTKEFLNEFRPKARAIYVSTQLLLEGFNDRRVNAVVLTYPTTSLVQLMQAAGRCMRYEPGKTKAFVVQAQNERLAYYLDHRWLYQEISDYLRPSLLTIEYSSASNLAAQFEALLRAHNVPDVHREAYLSRLSQCAPGDRIRLLLCGTPYFGHAANFTADAVWTGVMETAENTEEFRWIFNDFSARGALFSDPEPFLRSYGKKFGFSLDQASTSRWRTYADMLLAQYQAQLELFGGSSSLDQRPAYQNGATHWLKYVTFEYRPAQPEEFSSFIEPCHNRDALAFHYEQDPERFVLAIRIRVPMGQYEGWLLDIKDANLFEQIRQDLISRLKELSPSTQAATYEAAIVGYPQMPKVPFYVMRRIEQLLDEPSFVAHTLRLTQTKEEQSDESNS